MRLQDVIKEREAEITVLETTLKEKNDVPVILQNGTEVKQNGVHANGDATIHLSPKT